MSPSAHHGVNIPVRRQQARPLRSAHRSDSSNGIWVQLLIRVLDSVSRWQLACLQTSHCRRSSHNSGQFTSENRLSLPFPNLFTLSLLAPSAPPTHHGVDVPVRRRQPVPLQARLDLVPLQRPRGIQVQRVVRAQDGWLPFVHQRQELGPRERLGKQVPPHLAQELACVLLGQPAPPHGRLEVLQGHLAVAVAVELLKETAACRETAGTAITCQIIVSGYLKTTSAASGESWHAKSLNSNSGLQ
jgi:hypothetical protein